MLDPIERENEIMDTLRDISGAGLDFVLVGGYAVSAFRHRFSVDADIVVRREDLNDFDAALKKRGYSKTVSKELENEYSSEFVRYEKENPKTNVDLFVGGVGVRQTGASFGFGFLSENSVRMKIRGTEKEIEALIPKREILIILKLHSGRLTDFRDIAALSFGLDFSLIRKHVFRGRLSVLKGNMRTLGELVEKREFRDSFKGVFAEKEYRINVNEIRKLASL